MALSSSVSLAALITERELRNYSETVETIVAATAATPLDLVAGNVKAVTLQANTTFSFVGAATSKASTLSVRVTQDAIGNRAVTWPASVRWAGGTVPNQSTGANQYDWYTFVSVDGVSWDGFRAGANFS